MDANKLENQSDFETPDQNETTKKMATPLAPDKKSEQKTSQLLKNGATLYLKLAQLIFPEAPFLSETDEMAAPVTTSSSNRLQNWPQRKLTPDEAKIQAVLISSEKNIQQIEALTGIDQVHLIEQLAIMELEGLVALSGSGSYSFRHTVPVT